MNCLSLLLNLTNRFHDSISGTRGVAECVTDVLTTFWRLLWSITESDARQHGIYLFYMLCVAKDRNWSRKIAPLSNLTQASLFVEWKLTAKAELNCEIYKSWRKCWKNQVSFCHRSSPVSRKAWTLPWKLQELKNYPRKTCGYGQPRSHLIRVLNKRSVNDEGDFRLLWLVILKSAWYSVGDTFWLRYCLPWTVVSYT